MDANICYSIGFVMVFFLLHLVDKKMHNMRNKINELRDEIRNQEKKK